MVHDTHTYIEAYDKDGNPILGTLDSQACIIGFRDYRRCHAYKRVKVLPKEQLSLNGRAVEYRVIRGDKILEVIKKD